MRFRLRFPAGLVFPPRRSRSQEDPMLATMKESATVTWEAVQEVFCAALPWLVMLAVLGALAFH